MATIFFMFHYFLFKAQINFVITAKSQYKFSVVDRRILRLGCRPTAPFDKKKNHLVRRGITSKTQLSSPLFIRTQCCEVRLMIFN